MPRPIYAEIDIQALKHNLARLRESVGDRTLWAVVKANAYGHGLENAVEAFADADGFATIDLCDAERARRAGWHKRVLLLEGFFEKRTSSRFRTLTSRRSSTPCGRSTFSSVSSCVR